ncbi:MAG: hypothetical protein AAF039_08435 [Bacteroidota bacterium]
MKKVFTCFIGLLICFGCSDDAEDQINASEGEDANSSGSVADRVLIPDAAFEQALIDLNFDDELDGEVDKNRIDFISELTVNDKGISDLTGISEFDALVNLNVRNNEITSLDISNNTSLLFVWAEDNELETINTSRLSSLEKLGLDRNNLESINVSANTAIQLLTVSNNQLDGIDVSSNNALTDFTVVGNPLSCILVNESQLNNIPTDWSKDETDSYSLDCQ